MNNSLLNKIFVGLESEILEIIENSVITKKQITISSPNSYIYNFAMNDSMFMDFLLKFNILQPDGIGMYFLLKIFGGNRKNFERMTGTELYIKIIQSNNNYKIFLVGGATNSKNCIVAKFINYKFSISGFLPSLIKDDIDVKKINKTNSDILLVGLGTPKQEEWIIRNKDKLNVPIIIAVGSGIDFLAGVKKRAPLWMRKIGLEWLYRLFQEPRRLWKRYIFGIPVFIFHIIIQKVKLTLKKV